MSPVPGAEPAMWDALNKHWPNGLISDTAHEYYEERAEKEESLWAGKSEKVSSRGSRIQTLKAYGRHQAISLYEWFTEKDRHG